MSLEHNHTAYPAPELPSGPDHFIDVSDKVCPMTFVHARLALDKLAAGKVLAVRVKGEEATRNIPRTSTEQGHTVLRSVEAPDGTVTVYIRKKPA